MCVSKEKGIGENQTVHDHLYAEFKNAISFNSIKKVFPTAHIEFCVGTAQQNRDYIFKTGKYLEDEKRAEFLDGFQFEIGELPEEQQAKKQQGKRNDLIELKNLILENKSNAEIYNINPAFMKYCNSIDRLRNDLLSEKYKKEWRDIETTYIHGKTGTGKTRGVMELYGYENVYRITDYDHPFDNYQNQDVIIFEEFRSSLKIQDMLNYLDGYPLTLPSRYSNKVACYHKIYIITNIHLAEQFEAVQENHPETYNAFLRRIQHIKVYEDKNNINCYDQEEQDNGTFNYFNEFDVPYFEIKK